MGLGPAPSTRWTSPVRILRDQPEVSMTGLIESANLVASERRAGIRH